MVFVSSSLQHPVCTSATCATRQKALTVGRVGKRPRIKPPSEAQKQLGSAPPKPAPRPAPTSGPEPTDVDASFALAPWVPYVSAQGLGPMMAHPRLAPGLLKTQHALDLGEPTDQHESGRCWIFASLNWLRQHVRKAYGKEFQYSQNYVAYWDKVERANTIFNRMIGAKDRAIGDREMDALNDLFTDGGTWEFFHNVVQKYGVVPDYAMPETRLAGHSGRYMRKLQRRVRELSGVLRSRACANATAAELESIKAQGMQEVRRMLDLCLGKPPTKFLWQDPNTPHGLWVEKTPLAFLADNPAKLENMVYLSHYPQHPLRSRLMFDDVTNMDGSPASQALNVPMPVIKQAIRRSLRAGEAVLSYSDTIGLDEKHDLWSLGTDQSVALLGVDVGLSLSKGERVLSRVSGANHAMMFSGCDNAKPRKYQGPKLPDAEAELLEPLWQIENSWGGKPMYMTDLWVDAYVFGVIVNKDHLSAQARRLLQDETLPTEHVPPWSATRPMLD